MSKVVKVHFTVHGFHPTLPWSDGPYDTVEEARQSIVIYGDQTARQRLHIIKTTTTTKREEVA